MGEIKYSIAGNDFKQYGVFVSSSKGIVNLPKLKSLNRVSWDNYHGEDVDFEQRYYEPREIILSCFIKADSLHDFLERLFNFEHLFTVKGLQRLSIVVDNKPLVYEVYCRDEINVTKTWSNSKMVGTFDLKLIEPQPIKKVLKHIRTSDATKTCKINITTHKLVNIYWGDGTVDEDISGNNKTILHHYKNDGEYFPLITGCIDEIESFQTNAIIIWNKL